MIHLAGLDQMPRGAPTRRKPRRFRDEQLRALWIGGGSISIPGDPLGSAFDGNFASLFPGAYLVIQSDLGLTYGGTMLAAAGNTSTNTITLTGTLASAPVPIRFQSNSNAAIGVAFFSISTDGGSSYTSIGIPPVATPVALTGVASGLSATWSAGNAVANDTWNATSSAQADQSGNGKHCTQAVATVQPMVVNGLNGKVALSFDGANDFIQNAAFALSAPATTPFDYFLVTEAAAAGGQQIYVGSNGAATIFSDTGALNRTIEYCGAVGNVSTVLTAAPTRIRAQYTGTIADKLKVGSAADITGASSGNSAVAGISIGAGSLGGVFPGKMTRFFAFVICPPMSAAQLATVDAALNSPAGYGVGGIIV